MGGAGTLVGWGPERRTVGFSALALGLLLLSLMLVWAGVAQAAPALEAHGSVEQVYATGLAPGATIDVYTAPSPGSDGIIYDPVDPYSAMINSDTDQIISTSWGLCEQAIETVHGVGFKLGRCEASR